MRYILHITCDLVNNPVTPGTCDPVNVLQYMGYYGDSGPYYLITSEQ